MSRIKVHISWRKAGQRLLSFLLLLLLATGVSFSLAGKKVSAADKQAGNVTALNPSRWDRLLDKYQARKKTKQLLFVKYKGGSRATVSYYRKKVDGTFRKCFSVLGYVGKRGIDKVREGDKKTPTGTFTPTLAFGNLKDPGAKLPYTKVTGRHYWSSDRKKYNRLVKVGRYSSAPRGEHLIDYKKPYAYALEIGYNRACTYGKGSAIFLHCYGSNRYTLGCISVPKSYMRRIIRTMDPDAKICIYHN